MTRASAQKALLNYGVGITQELMILAKNPETKMEIVYQIPPVLEQIDSQESVNALIALLESGDVNLRLEALRSLNTVQRDFPHLNIHKEDIVGYILEEINVYKEVLGVFYKENQLIPKTQSTEVSAARTHLVDLLERRLDGTLERIFRLIDLRYPPEDVISVYQGIKSINESTRLNSVEFLDNLLEPSLKKALVPIAESAIIDTITKETVNSLKIEIPDEHKCFALLLEGRDMKIKLAVLKLILVLGDVSHLDLIRPFVDSSNEKVKKLAEEAVKQFS